jgi:CheY-like chemotaxis protein
MMEQLLHLAGFAPVTVPNGVEALQLLRSGLPAKVILLDLQLLMMDGWAFRREQRRDPKLAGIPVIVTSVVDERHTHDLAAQGVFAKPLDFDSIIARVRELCVPEAR